jgi:hypothetical protein
MKIPVMKMTMVHLKKEPYFFLDHSSLLFSMKTIPELYILSSIL